MANKDFRKNTKKKHKLWWLFFTLLIWVAGSFIYRTLNPDGTNKPTKEKTMDVAGFENGIYLATGFKEGEGIQEVIVSCTPCHSAKLVAQNRATKEGWIGIIKWMQATQNLWDLGENEAIIVDYLSKHYAPEEMGRGVPLKKIEWYMLEN